MGGQAPLCARPSTPKGADMASTVGSTTVEIVVSINDKAKGDPREAPVQCEAELAAKIDAFRSGSGAPTAILPFFSKTPQGDDVYGAILII